MNTVYFKNNILKTFVTLALLGFLSACASEAEKQERRENSFDLSGDYKTSMSKGSELDMNLQIQNESGRHNIVAYVERLNPISAKEIALLKAQGINHETVSTHFKNKMVLGKGSDGYRLDGGDNISTDFGESSQFHVCTAALKYNAEYEISYCVAGTALKSSKTMKGNLSLHWLRQRPVTVDGKASTEHTSGNASLAFKSDMSLIFYKQYLGIWSGDVHSTLGNVNTESFKKMMVREISDNAFETSIPGLNSFSYQNETYTYEARYSQLLLDYLKKPEYPAIQMGFKGPNGKRIVWIGQIWSLGNFTGSITLILPDTQVDIGTFRMKKD